MAVKSIRLSRQLHTAALVATLIGSLAISRPGSVGYRSNADIDEVQKSADIDEGQTRLEVSEDESGDQKSDESLWPADIGFLSPSLFRDHVGQKEKSPEISALLQWVCARLESTLPEVEYTWSGYDTAVPKEPVFVAVMKENGKELSTDVEMKEGGTETRKSFETFDVICRKSHIVSEEARIIVEKETEQGLQFLQEELSKVHACLAKHTKLLMDKHSNLQIMSASKLKSKGFGTKDAQIYQQMCIVLYVHVKGIVPFQEDPFPKDLDGIPTDTREGLFYRHSDPEDYHDSLMMGIKIASTYNTSGTLGAFVELGNGQIGCLTCCHVFESKESNRDLTTNPCCHKYLKSEVFQPALDDQSPRFGTVVDACMKPGDENTIGVDAALIQITERRREPVSGQFPDVSSVDTSEQSTGFPKDIPREFCSGKIWKDFREVPHKGCVSKYGYKTSLTKGELHLKGGVAVRSKPCFYSIHAQPTGTYSLHQQMEVKPVGTEYFSDSGDSGSLVFIASDKDSFDIRALGMLVGGTSYKTSIITPIWAILKKFGLPLKLMAFPGFPEERLSNLETQIRRELSSNTTLLEKKVDGIEEKVMGAIDTRIEKSEKKIIEAIEGRVNQRATT